MTVNWYRPTTLPIDPFGTPDRGYSTMRVTSPWGTRDDPLNPGSTVFHGGLDIGNARLGDEIVAVADGTVVDVGNLGLPWSQPTNKWPSGNYGGLMAILAHEGAWTSLYAHMRAEVVSKGQKMKAGQKVGEVGESGSATGAGHLHFGIIHRSAEYILDAGILIPNTWTVDPWPLIKDSMMTWLDDIRRVAPFIVTYQQETASYTRPRALSDFLDRRIAAGGSRVVVGTVEGQEVPAGSGNTAWDVFLKGSGPAACVPSARRGKVTKLVPDTSMPDVTAALEAAKAADADIHTTITELGGTP